MRYYRPVDVWIRQSERTVARYRCLEVFPERQFCVQSKDFYHAPFREVDSLQLDRQFIELLAEVPPESRSDLFGTVEEAIRAHDRSFEDDSE